VTRSPLISRWSRACLGTLLLTLATLCVSAVLGTGEQNIKLHRAHIMEKMGVESLADQVRAAERLGVGKSVIGNQ
jgi:FixJ family two-component response regulator